MSDIFEEPLAPARLPQPLEVWEDGRNLSYIGVTAIDHKTDVVLGYAFVAKQIDLRNWERHGEAVILTLSAFASGRYKFNCNAQ